MRGSRVKVISKKALSELDLPVPDLTTLDKIIQLAKLSGMEADSMKALAVARRKLVDQVTMNAAQKENVRAGLFPRQSVLRVPASAVPGRTGRTLESMFM